MYVNVQRLSSLLIVTQLVNQCTELVVPWLVDRFLRAPQRPQLEDDSEEDKIRAQRSLPPFPVSPSRHQPEAAEQRSRWYEVT